MKSAGGTITNRAPSSFVQSLTESPRVAADRPLYYTFLALLLWLPLPLGSNRIWAWSIMEVWVLLLAVGWLIQFLRGRVWLSQAFHRAMPVTICLALIVLWTGLQTLILPAELLGVLSPQALELLSVDEIECPPVFRAEANQVVNWIAKDFARRFVRCPRRIRSN